MAGDLGISLYRNRNDEDTLNISFGGATLPEPSVADANFTNPGYNFKYWSTSRNDAPSSTRYEAGTVTSQISYGTNLYAIWEADYIDSIKTSDSIEHPIKDTISGYITDANVPIAMVEGTWNLTNQTITLSNNTFSDIYNLASSGKAVVIKVSLSAYGTHQYFLLQGATKYSGNYNLNIILIGTDSNNNISEIVFQATGSSDSATPVFIPQYNQLQEKLTFDGTYDASTNKAATVSTVTNAINALDGGTIGTGSTTKTITSLSQSNGNVSATFNDIAFPVTSVNGNTGAVTTAENFVITATAISGTSYYNLDKTCADILSAINQKKYVVIQDVDMTYPYTTTVSQGIVFGATLISTGEGNQLLAVTDGILVAQSGSTTLGMAVHSSTVLPTMSDIPSASSITPLMDGTADVGIQTYIYARADHVHPTDTSRAPLASPEFTGTPTAPTATAGTNTTQIATTAFVKKAIDDALFVAEYGVTTYAEISAVLDADKPLFCYVNWNDIVCPYIGIVNNQYAFSSLGAGESTVSLYVNSSNQWSYATTNLATQSAVNAKQDALVSGTNIKTINNESILGSGNIDTSGGGSSILFVTVTYANYTYTADTTYADMTSAISNGKDIVVILIDQSQQVSWYYTMVYAPKTTSENFCFATENELGLLKHLLVNVSDAWWTVDVNIGDYAKKASPAFTGNPTAPTQTAGNNSTRIATTAFVQGEKKNLVVDGDSSLDISSLADLKTQLSTWFATMEDCSTAFFWFHVPTAFSLLTPGDKLVRLQRATSSWGFAEIFSDFGNSGNTMRARYFGRSNIYINFGSGTWFDPVPIRATLGNYYDYNNRPTDANTAIPHIHYDGGLYTFAVTSSMTSNKPVSDGHIIQSTWDYTGDYSTQLFLPNATTNGTTDNGSRHVQVRGCYNGTWKTWESLAWMSDVTNAINTAIGSAILASY